MRCEGACTLTDVGGGQEMGIGVRRRRASPISGTSCLFSVYIFLISWVLAQRRQHKQTNKRQALGLHNLESGLCAASDSTPEGPDLEPFRGGAALYRPRALRGFTVGWGAHTNPERPDFEPRIRGIRGSGQTPASCIQQHLTHRTAALRRKYRQCGEHRA